YIIDEITTCIARAEHDACLAPGALRWDRDRLLMRLLDDETHLPWIPEPRDPDWVGPPGSWDWGLFPIERMASIVLDLVRRSMRRAHFDSRERAELGILSGRLHDLLARLRELRNSDTWQAAVPPPALIEELVAKYRDDAQGLERALTGDIQ